MSVMSAVLDISLEEMAEYRTTARRRWERDREAMARRQARAWEAARRAAQLLKSRFGATRVVAFGSLVHRDCFTRWSDVDIAAWGLRPEDTFRAIGMALEVDSEIEVNLVDVTACRPSLLAVIEREGRDL